MIFTNEQSSIIYDKLYDWLTVYTPGSTYSKGRLKEYQKKVWDPVKHAINCILKQSSKNEEEKEFLASSLYSGPIFRIQNYNPRSKGYINENGYFQSWSKSIDGITSVTNLEGEVLLIVGTAVQGIDIFGLLCYLLENKYEMEINQLKIPKDLGRYEMEDEISYPITITDLTSVVSVNKDQINDWKNCSNQIPRDKWRRF